jgi:hypothetical protein
MRIINRKSLFLAEILLAIIISPHLKADTRPATADSDKATEDLVLHGAAYPNPLVDTSIIGTYILSNGRKVRVVPIGHNIPGHVLGADIALIKAVGGTTDIAVAPAGVAGAAGTLQDPIHINDLNDKIAGRSGLNIVFRGGEHIYTTSSEHWEIRIDGDNNTFDAYQDEKVIISGTDRTPTATTSAGWGAGGLRIKGNGNLWQRMSVANMPLIGIRVEGNNNTFQAMQVYKCFGSGVAFFDNTTPNTHLGQGGSHNIIRHSYLYLNSGADVVDHPDYPGRYNDGGNSDGSGASKGTVGNIWENLTIWKNSDDALDFWISKDSVARNVISAFNGSGDGDGNGFKFGGDSSNIEGDTGKVINSISFQDRAEAFSNNGGINSELRNITAISGGTLNIWIGTSSSVIDSISANGSDYLQGAVTNLAQAVSLDKFISLDPLSPNFARPKTDSGLQNQGAYAAGNEGAISYTLPNNQWQQVGLPRALPSKENTVAAVFGDDLNGLTYNTHWVVYFYDTAKGNYVNPGLDGELQQGVGYWIIQKSGGAATLSLPSGSTATSSTTSTQCPSNKKCFEIPLITKNGDTGWNMLSHVFELGVTLNQLRVITNAGSACASGCTLEAAKIAGIVHDQFWYYDGASYQELGSNDQIKPWHGFWAATLNRTPSLDLEPKLLIPKP